MSKTVAIVGCTHAGVFAATSILAEHPDWDVHVFERNETVSFLSCGIALWVGDHVSNPNKMFYSSPILLAEQGVHVHMMCDVTKIDIGLRQLEYKEKSNDAKKLKFDKLVVTTGSKPVVPNIAGIHEALDAEKLLLCKTWEDGKEIKRACTYAKSVIVVGAGYIGAELAEQLSERGVEVTLIDGAPHVLARTCDTDTAVEVEKAYTEHGVTLALGELVEGFDLVGEDEIQVRTSKGTYRAELAILGVGFLPRTELVSDQLDVLENGAIIIDEYGRATLTGEPAPDPDVFAAGDAATVFYNPTQTYDYIPLATNAVRQGILVGKNIDGAHLRYLGTQATSAVQLYDLSLASTGMTLQDCAKKGVDASSVTIQEDYRPDFMLTTTPVKATLVWEKTTGRILGAQFVSKQPDVAQAANAVSVAIQAGFKVSDLAGADFLFQPNFSQPINYVCSVALAAVAKLGN